MEWGRDEHASQGDGEADIRRKKKSRWRENCGALKG